MSILLDRAIPVHKLDGVDLDREQQKRVERAAAERDHLIVYRVDESTAWVENTRTRNVYTCTRGEADWHCDCPDHRRFGGELFCKHLIAWFTQPSVPTPRPLDEPLTAPERQARMDRLDWLAGR